MSMTKDGKLTHWHIPPTLHRLGRRGHPYVLQHRRPNCLPSANSRRINYYLLVYTPVPVQIRTSKANFGSLKYLYSWSQRNFF